MCLQNFKQQLKIKNCDEDDIELFLAFFSKKAHFEAYLKSESSTVEVRYRNQTGSGSELMHFLRRNPPV